MIPVRDMLFEHWHLYAVPRPRRLTALQCAASSEQRKPTLHNAIINMQPLFLAMTIPSRHPFIYTQLFAWMCEGLPR